jgi:integrase
MAKRFFPTSYTVMIRTVAKGLGLRYGREIEDGFTPHTARHTAATEMMRARVDPSAVQKVLGHSDQTMTLHYTHADREGMRAAVDSLLERKRGSRQKVDKSLDRNLTKPTARSK